jgi:mRNA interferase HicA
VVPRDGHDRTDGIQPWEASQTTSTRALHADRLAGVWQASFIFRRTHFSLDIRTDLSETRNVRSAEFERRVQKLARRKKVTCQFVADKGKGSHGRLYFGEEFTTLKDRKKEIGRDLLAKMCRDLNVDPHDL